MGGEGVSVVVLLSASKRVKMTARAYLNDQRGSSTFIETKQVQIPLLYHMQVEPKVNQKK